MSSYVSRLILAGCLMVPCLVFGQVTIECIVNETVTAGECNDCTNITDSVFVKFGLRCINGSDTTILEGPVRIKARGSSGDVVMFDYRANPPQGSTQSFFFNVSAAAQFGDIQDVFAYVRDCASFLVDYGDSTKRVHWGDTMFVTYPEATIAPGDSTYYWIIQANGVDPDTITMSEVVNFVESGMVTITKGPTNVVIHVPNMFDTCFHTLTQLTDSTAQLTDCNGLDRGTVTFSANTGASLSDSCVQHLYALPDSSNRLILTDCEGNPMDTVDFYGIGVFNDSRLDSLKYSGDTLTAYIRDTSGIVDSIKVEIVLGDTDTDIDSMKLIGNVLHLWEDEVELTVDLSQFMDNTDDQQVTNFNFNTGTRVLTLEIENDGQPPHTVTIPDDTGTDDQQLSLVTDGLIDTIFLENGGFVVLHDSVGIGQPDTYLDSIRHITDGLIDSIWFYRDSTGHLVDSFLVVLHDSVGSGITTNDTYLSATWCSGDTLFAERSDTSGIIDTLIVAGIPCSRDTCEILIEPITYPSAFGYEHVTGLRYTYCGVVDSVCFVNSIRYIPYYHGEDTLYFLTEEIIDCDSATYGIYPIYIDPGNDIRVDTTWFVDDTLYQQRVDTSGIIDTIITEIQTKDFDFIRLHGDTAVTTVDTLIPRDSSDLHKLIWHGGRVRLGLPPYEHSIYLDTTTGDYLNFVLHQDSVDTGLQIFGRRSALDIYHHTRPYVHHRNQFGEFWLRIFDPTAEGPLEPQRWEFGAVGKYEGDTTSRPIFTIRNDADPFSLNITPNFLQSDIYKSDRAIDTANIHGIFAADSSGRFVLMQVDSVGDINVINPQDSDWLRIPDYGIPNYDEDKFTLGRVRIGIDSLSTASAKVIIQGGVVPFITRSTASSSLHRQQTLGNNLAWDFASAGGDYVIDRVDLGASTTQRYFWLHGGSGLSGSANFQMDINGEISLGAYPSSRDDGLSSSSITRIYTPNAGGDIKLASIDSLAAALQLTGIISGSDSLGRNGTAGRVVLETSTKAPQSTANLFFDVATTELGVGTSLPAQTIHVQGTARITGSDGTATTVMGRDADGDISTVALGTNLSITSGTLNAASTADLLGTAFPTDEVLIGTNTTSGASTPDFTYNRTSGSASRKIWLNSGAVANIEMGFNSGGLSSSNRPQFVGFSDGSTGSTIPAITFFGGKYGGTYPGSMSNFGDADAALFQLSGGAYRGSGIQTAAQILIDGDGTMTTTGYSGKIVFNTSAGSSSPVERMRINKDGFVGIGQTNPAYYLDVLVPSTTSNGLSITAAGATRDADLYFQNSADAADSWRLGRLNNGNLYISYSSAYPYSITSSPFVIEANSPASLLWLDNTSRIGILTNNPQQTLHVAGTMRLTGSSGTATGIMGRDGNGNVSAVSLGTGLSMSSGTLNTADNSATNEIQNLGTGTRTATTYPITISSGTGMTLGLFSDTEAGLVPADGGLAGTYFLNAGGGWSIPAGGGADLLGTAFGAGQMIYGDGTTSGTSSANIIAEVGANEGITINSDNGTTGDAFLRFRNTPDNADSWQVYRTTTGNFVLGYSSAYTYSATTTPIVVFAGTPTDALRLETTASYLRASNGNTAFIGDNGDEMGFYYDSGSTETRMRADNAGTGSYLSIANAGNINLVASGASDLILLQADGNVHLNSTANDIVISSGGAAGDVIEMTSFDQISITSNNSYISLVPNGGSDGELFVLGGAGTLHISNAPATGGTAEYITISTSTIGLNLNGSTAVGVSASSIEIHGGTANTYNLEVNGTASRVGGTTWANESDRRLKEDIVSITDSYDKIMGLNPVTFRYNEQYLNTRNAEDRTYTGFIAQEYREVFPEDVQGNEEMGTLSISPDAVGPYSVAAIQQLIRDNEQQAAQISVLTEQINKLYDLINKK